MSQASRAAALATRISQEISSLRETATTASEGPVELATPAEGIAGTDTVRAITAEVLKAVLEDRFWVGTQAQLDAIVTKKATTFYHVLEG